MSERLDYAEPLKSSTRWWRHLIIVVAVFAAAAAVIVTPFVFRYALTRHHVGLAGIHSPVVERRLGQDHRISQFQVYPVTRDGGALHVRVVCEPGSMKSIEDEVIATAPPIPIEFDMAEINLKNLKAGPALVFRTVAPGGH